MTLMARTHSKAHIAKEMNIQAAKIHFEYSSGIAGSILDDHLSYARRLIAVKVSAPKTATATMARNHNQA